VSDYNSVDGIRTYLDDLTGLHRLIKDRSSAFYDREERLQRFVILGHWSTDSCGNFGQCTFGNHFGSDVSWIPSDLPPVVQMDDLHLFKNLTITTTFNTLPPRPDSTCAECGLGWTIENTHDFMRHARADTFQHVYCHKLSAEREVMQEFRGYLDKAGLERALLSAIPNEYWKEDTAEPWCLARTPFGTLKIGWRKRVLNIDWSAVLNERLAKIDKLDLDTRYDARAALHKTIDANTLFPNEDVTRWETGIHAWGAEKAVEYLKVIREKVLGR